MRIFPEAEERLVFELEAVRTWRRSGLLSEAEAPALESDLGKRLQIAGWAVRGVLFALTAIAQLALWLLVFRDFKPAEAGMALLALSAGYIVFAEAAIPQLKVYRFGADEALVAGAGLQAVLGVMHLAHAWNPALEAWLIVGIPALVVCAAIYARYGYAAALLGTIPCCACIVFGAAGPAVDRARLECVLLFLAALAVSRARVVEDYERPVRQLFEACLFLAAYLLLNLRLEAIFDPLKAAAKGPFYWGTFAAVWALPFAGLALGLRLRHRALLAAGVITFLISLATMKPYFRLERNAWDPAVLGVFLLAVSALLARWLGRGPQGRRRGFTAKRLLQLRDEGFSASAIAGAWSAAAVQAPGPGAAGRFEGGGGSAGGAGASGGF